MENNNTISTENGNLNSLSKIAGIFFYPGKLIKDISRNPVWLLPFILLFSVSVINKVLVHDIVMTERVEAVQNKTDFSQERKESLIQGIHRVDTPVKRYISFGLTPIELILTLLIISSVLYYTGNKFLGKEVAFPRLFSLVTFSSLIIIPESLITTPLILLKESSNFRIGINLLFSEPPQNSIFYGILYGINIFGLWQLMIVSYGLKVFYKSNFVKTIMLTGLWWIVYLAGKEIIQQYLQSLGL